MITRRRLVASFLSLVFVASMPQAHAGPPPTWPAVTAAERGPACADIVEDFEAEGSLGATATAVAPAGTVLVRAELAAPACPQVTYTAYLTTGTGAGDWPPAPEQILAQSVASLSEDRMSSEWRLPGSLLAERRVFVTSSIGRGQGPWHGSDGGGGRVVDVARATPICVEVPGRGIRCIAFGLRFR